MTKDLYAHFERPHRSQGRIGSLRRLQPELQHLLSVLAHPSGAAATCYKAGAEHLHLAQPMSALEYFAYEQLNSALAQLRELKHHLKQQLLEACAAVALADGQMHSDQHALLHGIAATLDCPLPLIAQSE